MSGAGTLSVIVGCMSSGKSEALLREIRRARIAGEDVLVLAPATDTRAPGLFSRTGEHIPAQRFASADELEALVVGSGCDLAVIDEVQFLSAEEVDTMLDLVDAGFSFVVAGLNLDFRGEPFGEIGRVLAHADSVMMLTAICMKCRRKDAATRTQRLVDGRPSSWFDPIVVIDGAADVVYEARCPACHEVPGKPSRRRLQTLARRNDA